MLEIVVVIVVVVVVVVVVYNVNCSVIFQTLIKPQITYVYIKTASNSFNVV